MAKHHTQVPTGAVAVRTKHRTPQGEATVFVGYHFPEGEDLFLRDRRTGNVTRCHKREVAGEAWSDHELVKALARANRWTVAYTRQWLREMISAAADVERMLDTCNPPGPGCPDPGEPPWPARLPQV